MRGAAQILSRPLPASGLLASKPKSLPADVWPVWGLSTKGVIVPEWAPYDPATNMASGPGSLLLVDLDTGQSLNLMGKVPTGIGPIASQTSGQWVVWDEGPGEGGPQTFYSEDLATGKAQTVQLPVAWGYVNGSLALEGSTLYWLTFQGGPIHGCDTGEIGTVSLTTEVSSILLRTSSCGTEKMKSVPPTLSTQRGHFPLHLKGGIPGGLSVWGNHLVFSWVTGLAGSSYGSALVDMDLQTRSLKTLLTAPPPQGSGQGAIGGPAADAYLVAFDVGQTVYVYDFAKRKIFLLGQGEFPTVSGPYVAWAAVDPGLGDLYDSKTGHLYMMNPDYGVTLFGNTLFWSEDVGSPAAPKGMYATLKH